MSIWRRGLKKTDPCQGKKNRPDAVTSRTQDQNRRASEARKALLESENLLKRIEQREEAVDELHKTYKDLGERNGFAALILNTLKGGVA